MPLIYIIPISLSTLIISYLLFKRAAGSLNPLKPNMISYIFYYNVILQTFIASLLVVLKADGEHYVIARASDDARFYGWLAINYMMVIMPIGMLLAKAVFSTRTSIKARLNNYTNQEVDIGYIGYKSLKYSVWVFTILSSLACLYVFYVIGYFPFFKIFNVSSLMASELRITASREFPGNVYVKNLFALMMMPILSYVWMFYYIRTKNALDLIIFIISFVLSLSILYYNFAKSPMLTYILSFIFVYYYAKGTVNKTYALTGITLVLLLLFAFYSFIGLEDSEFFSYNSGPIGRVILGQAAGLYMMFDIFPDDYNYIGLASTSNLLSSILGIDYIDRAARTAMVAFNPVGVAAGTSGVMNTIYLGEAWANFGLLGILLSPLWVGFIIQTLYIYFLKAPKSPLHLAFFVSFSLGGSITGGFNDYIYNPGVLSIILFFCAVYLLAKTFKKIA